MNCIIENNTNMGIKILSSDETTLINNTFEDDLETNNTLSVYLEGNNFTDSCWILIAYGSVHFASKAGTLAGNHFATITSDLEKLREIGVATMWDGSKKIRFYEQ